MRSGLWEIEFSLIEIFLRKISNFVFRFKNNSEQIVTVHHKFKKLFRNGFVHVMSNVYGIDV